MCSSFGPALEFRAFFFGEENSKIRGLRACVLRGLRSREFRGWSLGFGVYRAWKSLVYTHWEGLIQEHVF